MPWTIDYLDAEKVVQVTTSGTLRLLDLRQMAVEALEHAQKESASRFLLDHRRMTPEMQAIEIYNLPRMVEQWGVNRQHRIAIVYDPKSAKRSTFQFYENRACNVGLDHRLFTRMDAALRWISSQKDA